MRKLIFVAALVVLGCEGPRGPQGERGAAGPNIDRSKIYCALAQGVATRIGATNIWEISASCRSQADIPLTGECHMVRAATIAEFFILSDSSPIAWPDPAAVASWRCEWSPLAGAPTPSAAQFPGVAEICCYTP